MAKGYLVLETIEHAHYKNPKYPLLEGDLLQINDDETYTKVAPGIAIAGFKISDEAFHKLKEVEYTVFGMDYRLKKD